MRGALVLLAVAACGSRSAAPPPEPPSNASTGAPSGGAICADSVHDTAGAVDGPMDTPINYRLSTGELVAREIRKRMPVFQLCYAQQLKARPAMRGRVTARFTVQKNGTPAKIHTFGFDAELDQCVCEKLSALTFGSLDRDETVEYAFVFVPGA